MGEVFSTSKFYKNVDMKSHPRKTHAYHLKECRLCPFPGENEHNIKWNVRELGTIHRCYLTGCETCDNLNVFIEKVQDSDSVYRLSLRRVLSTTKTVTIRFLGLEDINLAEAVQDGSLTNRLMVSNLNFGNHHL